jgi:thioredoxin 1|tara:strand:- start:20 stop:331 length:312 start_codon:yes stop_codon:yes gene_type:complete
MADIIEVNEGSFEKEVIKSSDTTLVYFWAEWCGPCKVMTPNTEEFAKNTSAVKVVKINVDDNQKLSQSFNIMSIPTVLVFKNGEVAKQAVGSQTPDQLETLTN